MQGGFVSLGGANVADALLTRVVIEQRLNDHWYCELECRDTMDQPIPGEGALGSECVVTNTAEDGTQHVSFSGTVIDVALKHEVWGQLHLRAASRFAVMASRQVASECAFRRVVECCCRGLRSFLRRSR